MLSSFEIMVTFLFQASMFLLWNHKHGPYLFLTVYIYILFVFIPFSCSWVTKYLECESLCSSCTRTEIIIIAMIIIIKKRIWLNYNMHHFRGGPVYCCIVTHKVNLFLKGHVFFLFVLSAVLRRSVCACIIYYASFASWLLTEKKKGFICQYFSIISSCKHVSTVPHLLHVSALRCEINSPLHTKGSCWTALSLLVL